MPLTSNPFFKLSLSLFVFLAIVVSGFISYASQTDPMVLDSSEIDEMFIIRGELTTISVDDLTRISITDPDIADITDADSDLVTLIGKFPGQTTLFIWDGHGKRSLNIHVGNRDLQGIKSRMKQLLDAALIHEVNLDANEKEGRVILSGEIPEHKEILYEEIANEFFEDIVNLVKTEEIRDLIQIDLQIAELSQTLDKALGIGWSAQGSSELSLIYSETLPALDGNVADFFKIGDFRRTSALQSRINAIIIEGKGRVLSKPKLVVESGQEASFLVGGEVPIRTTSSTSAGTSTENVSFKEYGVGMTITPEVVRGNKIEVLLTTEISDIDGATTSLTGGDIAFTTRSAQTQVLLDDGQTIILAGLIRSNQGEQVSRVPFLSKIPIAGALFRTKSKTVPDTDTEVVISMTPRIVNRNRSRFVERQEEERRKSNSAQKHKMYKLKGETLMHTGPLPFYAGIPPEMADYVSGVQQKISESIIYPKEARENGWQGTVKLGVMILQDGTLAYAMVKESSGFDLFDQYAVNTAKNVAPFGSFPTNSSLQELNVTIPIVYSLKRK